MFDPERKTKEKPSREPKKAYKYYDEKALGFTLQPLAQNPMLYAHDSNERI
jgi:hypothetical protein